MFQQAMDDFTNRIISYKQLNLIFWDHGIYIPPQDFFETARKLKIKMINVDNNQLSIRQRNNYIAKNIKKILLSNSNSLGVMIVGKYHIFAKKTKVNRSLTPIPELLESKNRHGVIINFLGPIQKMFSAKVDKLYKLIEQIYPSRRIVSFIPTSPSPILDNKRFKEATVYWDSYDAIISVIPTKKELEI